MHYTASFSINILQLWKLQVGDGVFSEIKKFFFSVYAGCDTATLCALYCTARKSLDCSVIL